MKQLQEATHVARCGFNATGIPFEPGDTVVLSKAADGGREVQHAEQGKPSGIGWLPDAKAEHCLVELIAA